MVYPSRVHGLAAPLAVKRRQIDRRRGQQRLHPAHALEIGVEPAGGRHRQAGEPGRELDIALRVHPPTLAVIDRAHRLLGFVERIERRIDRDRVTGPDQLLAVLDPPGDALPVAGLLRQAGRYRAMPVPACWVLFCGKNRPDRAVSFQIKSRANG